MQWVRTDGELWSIVIEMPPSPLRYQFKGNTFPVYAPKLLSIVQVWLAGREADIRTQGFAPFLHVTNFEI